MSSAKSARAPARKPAKAGAPAYRVRRSRVHGQGVFATRRIRKGTRVVEYLGERISHKEADRRYELKKENDNHTFLMATRRASSTMAAIRTASR